MNSERTLGRPINTIERYINVPNAGLIESFVTYDGKSPLAKVTIKVAGTDIQGSRLIPKQRDVATRRFLAPLERLKQQYLVAQKLRKRRRNGEITNKVPKKHGKTIFRTSDFPGYGEVVSAQTHKGWGLFARVEGEVRIENNLQALTGSERRYSGGVLTAAILRVLEHRNVKKTLESRVKNNSEKTR